MTVSIDFQARDLHKQYGEGAAAVHALRGLSFDINAGEVLVFLGPSGSGKSTLLNIIGGLDRASSGALDFRGQDLMALSDTALTRYRRRNIGFVFQFYNLIPSLTAAENVRLVTDIAADPLPAQDVLAQVGLSGRTSHYPAQLSGGEQQRVAVARAIAKRPDILLCDEPTGALDSQTGITVLEVLAQANRAYGTTLIIITHNSGIGAMADRVFHFLDGDIARIEHNDTRIAPTEINW